MLIIFSSIECVLSTQNSEKNPKSRGHLTKSAAELRAALWTALHQSQVHQQGDMFQLLCWHKCPSMLSVGWTGNDTGNSCLYPNSKKKESLEPGIYEFFQHSNYLKTDGDTVRAGWVTENAGSRGGTTESQLWPPKACCWVFLTLETCWGPPGSSPGGWGWAGRSDLQAEGSS